MQSHRKRCHTSYGRWLLLLLWVFVLTACGSGSSGFDEPVTVTGRVTDGTLTSPIARAACQFKTFQGDILAQDTSDDQGNIALDVPVGSVGFIECMPPTLSQLTLSTFVSTEGAQAGERIPMEGREPVSPATTLFNQRIGRRLNRNREAIKQNFLLDITSLNVRIRLENGRLTGFDVVDPQNVSELDVGLSAFAATALFNGFFQQGINADFQAAQQNLMEQERVRSASLEALGVPGQQAETLAIIVNTSIDMAADAFDVPVPSPPSDSTTPLGGAFAKARLRVRVLDREGVPLAGAMVRIFSTMTAA